MTATTDSPLHRLRRATLGALLGLGLAACTATPNPHAPNADTSTADASTAPALTDPKATTATRALYRNLSQLSGQAVLFGHQDTLAYGVEWVDEPGRSDIHSVTGAYPAVYGWELGDLELGAPHNLDNVNFDKMRGWIREGFQRGGVISIAWHANHPVTGGNSWDKQPAIAHIIPGGSHHATFQGWLDTLADFLQSLTYTDAQGQQQLIPVLFRPWHEHNGDWFWWGKGHTTEEDYITLWRYTIDYLRRERDLHNLIVIFSPDRSRIDLDHFERDYFYGYPGDAYVDILGLDNYRDMGNVSNPLPRAEQTANLILSLQHTARLAESRGKIPVLSETGLETVPIADFWTGTLLHALKADEQTRKIVYALVWRNANRAKEERDHYYAPYPGQISAEDFVRFYQDPFVRFGDRLPNLYR